MFTFLPCASHSHQVYWKQRDILGMDEGRGKGGSMKKSIQIVMTLICFAVGVGSAIFYFVMTRPNNGDSITAIGQTYEGSHISATAYDIKTFETPELQEKKQALVVVGFEIKNISKRSQVLVNSATYKAYVDDVAARPNRFFNMMSIWMPTWPLENGPRDTGESLCPPTPRRWRFRWMIIILGIKPPSSFSTCRRPRA